MFVFALLLAANSRCDQIGRLHLNSIISSSPDFFVCCTVPKSVYKIGEYILDLLFGISFSVGSSFDSATAAAATAMQKEIAVCISAAATAAAAVKCEYCVCLFRLLLLLLLFLPLLSGSVPWKKMA